MTPELELDVSGVVVRAREGDHYVSATSLCKAAGKKWNDYFRLKITQEFILTLSESTGIPVDSMVVLKSGRNGGTWIHPLVVIDFAQWASPAFKAHVIGWASRLLAGETVTLTDDDRAEAKAAVVDAIASPTPSPPALTADHVTDIVRRVVAEMLAAGHSSHRPALPGLSHPGPCWTVAARLEELHPEWKTTPTQRNKIAQRARNAVGSLLHEPVGYFGRDLAFHGHQIYHLDVAIRRELVTAIREKKCDGLGMFADMLRDDA